LVQEQVGAAAVAKDRPGLGSVLLWRDATAIHLLQYPARLIPNQFQRKGSVGFLELRALSYPLLEQHKRGLNWVIDPAVPDALFQQMLNRFTVLWVYPLKDVFGALDVIECWHVITHPEQIEEVLE
jgi:hypothetical protein